jgi:hypothetical protein
VDRRVAEEGIEVMQFTKARRQQAYLRLGLAGSAGSGKTYSGLLVARGLVGPAGRIALIDTEAGSASLYSHLTDFDVLCLCAPYEPRRYVDALKAAEAAKYDAVVVDSLSHAWAGEGGCLDIQGAIADSGKGNSYTAWRKVTPEHNRLVDALLTLRAHLIVTMRTKTEYALEDDGKGKKVPKKIGMAPVQRDGLEYEFTVVFDLDQTHNASVSKDRTGMFDGSVRRLDGSTGTRLAEWLAGAEPAPAAPAPAPASDAADVRSAAMAIYERVRAKDGAEAAKAWMQAIVTGKGMKDYTAEDVAALAAAAKEAGL